MATSTAWNTTNAQSISDQKTTLNNATDTGITNKTIYNRVSAATEGAIIKKWGLFAKNIYDTLRSATGVTPNLNSVLTAGFTTTRPALTTNDSGFTSPSFNMIRSGTTYGVLQQLNSGYNYGALTLYTPTSSFTLYPLNGYTLNHSIGVRGINGIMSLLEDTASLIATQYYASTHSGTFQSVVSNGNFYHGPNGTDTILDGAISLANAAGFAIKFKVSPTLIANKTVYGPSDTGTLATVAQIATTVSTDTTNPFYAKLGGNNVSAPFIIGTITGQPVVFKVNNLPVDSAGAAGARFLKITGSVSSGISYVFHILDTIRNGSTAGYDVFRVRNVESTIGSGERTLASFITVGQPDSARIDYTGKVLAPNIYDSVGGSNRNPLLITAAGLNTARAGDIKYIDSVGGAGATPRFVTQAVQNTALAAKVAYSDTSTGRIATNSEVNTQLAPYPQTIGTIDGQTAVANGATITAGQLWLQTAANSSATPGILATGATHTWSSLQTYSGGITVSANNITANTNIVMGTGNTIGNAGAGTLSFASTGAMFAANTASTAQSIFAIKATSVTATGGLLVLRNSSNTTMDSADILGNHFSLLSIRTPHIKGLGSAPSIAAGAGAGTSPTVSMVSGSTDMSGYVNITTGTLPTLSASIATITFATAYGIAPKVSLWASNGNAAALNGVNMVFVDQATGVSTTTFVITSGTTSLTAATAYQWGYRITE